MKILQSVMLVLLFGITALPACGQTPAYTLAEPVGHPTFELLQAKGAPNAIKPEWGPFWAWEYEGVEYAGIEYNVAYMVVGHMVVGMGSYREENDYETGYRAASRGLMDYMGKNLTEIIALEGPPVSHTILIRTDGYVYDDLAFRVEIDGCLYETYYFLEWDKVFAQAYHCRYQLADDKIPAYAAAKGAELAAVFNDPVWYLETTEGMPEPPDRFRYLKFAADERYNGSVFILALPGKNEMNFNMSIGEIANRGFMGRFLALGNLNVMVEKWEDSNKYNNIEPVTRGSFEKLKALACIVVNGYDINVE